ncbi:MAG: metallophosphoesterase [Bacilli bacterium]|nr:metallophosphoesterase [Bacilli bacterium]
MKKKKQIKVRTWVKIVFLLIIVVSSLVLYSRYLGIKGLEVKEYGIVDSKLPGNFYGFKIVQISDIHYKVTTTKEDLENIVKEINKLKPDIVLLSGDLFDSNIKYKKKDYEDLTNILSSIDYNIGKYAITGEDDLIFDEWENIITDSEFINLNDKYEIIFNEGIEPILLVGVSSNYKDNHIKETIDTIYSSITDSYNYSILLLHEPDFIDKIDYSKFNLILAGHSHNGQIKIPFIGGILKDKYSKNYYDEYYNLNNTKLYVSSGIGTSKYKFRFLNKPSINLYRLRNK